MSETTILGTVQIDAHHQVVSTRTASKQPGYMKKPCKDCPWRKDAVGVFPAGAFVQSAVTAHDMSNRVFGCHQSGTRRPKTCAGFLLSDSAQHNLRVRMHLITGKLDLDKVSGDGVELFTRYTEMAIANGVSEDDASLALCR